MTCRRSGPPSRNAAARPPGRAKRCRPWSTDVASRRCLPEHAAVALLARALAPLPEVRPGDDLAAAIADADPPDLGDGDVLVVAHKIVSKAERRVRRLGEIEPGERARALAAEHRKDPRLVQAVLGGSGEGGGARGGGL